MKLEEEFIEAYRVATHSEKAKELGVEPLQAADVFTENYENAVLRQYELACRYHAREMSYKSYYDLDEQSDFWMLRLRQKKRRKRGAS